MRTIADLPKDRPLGGVGFIYPEDGKTYYWRSQWAKGVWATKEPNAIQVFPLFVEDLQEVLAWKLAKPATALEADSVIYRTGKRGGWNK